MVFDYQSTGGELSSIDEDGEYQVHKKKDYRLRGPSIRGSSLFLNFDGENSFEEGRNNEMDRTVMRN